MLAYGLPAFVHGDVTGFLAGLARVSGLIRKVSFEGSTIRDAYGIVERRAGSCGGSADCFAGLEYREVDAV